MKKSYFLTTLLLVLIYPGIGYTSRVTVQMSGGMEKIEAIEENEVVYFSLSQLLEIIGERLSWDIVGISVSFRSDAQRATFFLGSPYISVNDTVRNITYPVRFESGGLYLPARTFIPMLDLMRSEQITWNANDKTIRIDSEWYNVTDVSLSPKANGLLVEIFLTEPRAYEIYGSEGNWLNVTIPDGRVNIRQIESRRGNKYLRDLNAYQFESSAQISFRLRREIGQFSHRFQPNPGRIQISLIDTTTPQVALSRVERLGPDDKIDKIIIDPGHGGKDYGAIGLRNTREKEVVLDIAKRLAKLIRKEKIFEVIMTREKDEYVTLEERAKIANDANGDIFVSIHANASKKRSAYGFQVFFLAPANNDAARAAAQLENAPFLAELNEFADDEDNLTLILSDMIQTEFQTESADLAEMINKEFLRHLNRRTKARGIDQAGFVVLNRVYMPSILVESAFLTNKNDENLLRDNNYKQDVAEAIYEGLKRFKAKYE